MTEHEETGCAGAGAVDALRQTDEPVPLRKRPIPDQLDYLGEQLAAQMNPGDIPRDTLIAMGAAIVNMGAIATELRKRAAEQPPLTDEYGLRITFHDNRTAEGAVADTLGAALDALADFDAKDRGNVLERKLRVRKVGKWHDIDAETGASAEFQADLANAIPLTPRAIPIRDGGSRG
jgi:hypothetical protein